MLYCYNKVTSCQACHTLSSSVLPSDVSQTDIDYRIDIRNCVEGVEGGLNRILLNAKKTS